METNEEVTTSTESTEAVEPETTDDSGGQAAASETTEAPRQDRKSRKQARLDVEAANRERDSIRTELGDFKSRYSALEGQFNEMRTQIERDRQQAQQSNASDQARKQVSSIRQQARNFLVQSAQAKDPAEAQRLLDKHDELMDEADDLRAGMRSEKDWEKRRGEIAGQMPNPAVQGEVMYFTAKYPWLDTNVKAQKMARAHFEELVAGGTRQANRETMEESVTWAAKVLGLGGTNGHATGAQRARYGGVSSGEGAGGGGGNSGDIAMTRENEAMALAAYRHLEPAKAIAQWKRDMNARKKELEGE